MDGGGIKGIYPASVLAEIERELLGGQPVGSYFDLVAGTSTGGILALGLAKGRSARYMRDLYIERGEEIFPSGRWRRVWRWFRQWAMYLYDTEALKRLAASAFENTTIRESHLRLCIPSFEALHSEVAVLRTPHHPTCTELDAQKTMIEVALSTSAAPTYFRPLGVQGYCYVDGGVWANNPAMIALVEALTCFDLKPDQIRILSLGCGREPYHVGWFHQKLGSLIAWRNIIFAAMHLQSENARNQSRLLVGPGNFVRLEPDLAHPIRLDDWARARAELPKLASTDLAANASKIRTLFFDERADRPTFF